ncbi:MAG: MEDS domain-containing protein [Pseudonocardia sp.]
MTTVTTTGITMGPPGVTMAPGDHICAFYRGREQRDALLVPFLREGLLAGDKCLCVMDDPETSHLLGPLSAQLDVELFQTSGQFELLTSDDAYLPDGRFVADRMMSFWESGFAGALDQDGYGFVRAVGEMTWALRDAPGVDQLVGYEGLLNRFTPRFPRSVLLCLYDLERFTDGEVLIGMLRTHPKVLMSGQLLENPWYDDPDEYLLERA